MDIESGGRRWIGRGHGFITLLIVSMAFVASIPAAAQEAQFLELQQTLLDSQDSEPQDFTFYVKRRFYQLATAETPQRINDSAIVFMLNNAESIGSLIPSTGQRLDAETLIVMMRRYDLLAGASEPALGDLPAATDLFLEAHYAVREERPYLRTPEGPPSPPRRRSLQAGGNSGWEPGYDVGSFSFYPAAGLRFVHDSNIFLERKDRDSDFIELLNGSIGVGFDEEHIRMRLDYQATQYWHHQHEEANRTEHASSVDIRWTASDEPIAPYIRLNGGYQKAAQPVDSAALSLVEIANWTAAARLGVDFGDTNVEGEVTVLDLSTDVDAIELFEHQQWMGTLRVLHQVGDDLNVVVEGGAGLTEFAHGLKMDNELRQVRAGVAWQAMRELVIGAHVGYHRRDYRRQTGFFGPGTDDFSGPVYDFSARWTPDEENRLTFFFFKDVQESLLSNFVRRHVATIAYSHDVADDITWSISASGEWGSEATDTAQRVKQRYSVTTGFDYEIVAPLHFVSSVLYRTKNTNDGLGDYDDWQFSIGFTWVFGRPLWPGDAD